MQRKSSMTRMVETDDFDVFEMSRRIEKSLAGDNSEQFKTKKSFSPSVLGYGHGTCARYWHMAFSGVNFADDFDATSALNMSNGNYVHDRLQKLFQDTYGEDKAELETKVISEDPPIFGFADILLELDDYKVVGEIKSAKQEIFDGIVNRQKPVNYHLVQLLIYMRVLGVDRGFFYYENKNTQQFIILKVTLNKALEEYTDEIFEWMRTVRAAWAAGELANPLSNKRTVKACRYCPVKKECLAREDGTVKIKQLEILE